MSTERSTGAAVERAVREALAFMKPSLRGFPWSDRRAYADWLSQTYHYVHHSTRLLAAAAARFPLDERGDGLHNRFLKHMAEERMHEKLCVHDLKVLGHTVTDFPERNGTRMFYEPQYYKLEHLDPTALFGYILVLEALGAIGDGRAMYEALKAAHGDTCLSFVKLHVEEDPDHLDKAFAIVEGCTPSQLALIEQNAWQTAHAYVAFLREIHVHPHRGA